MLAADGRRVDFVTTVDWHELHRLLKVEFPVSVQASEGINEIQFGYLKRPTHRSRLYDSDRFEVCNQRYSALCDESHGAAVLNDCKYGISMKENALQLTLLRARPRRRCARTTACTTSPTPSAGGKGPSSPAPWCARRTT